MAQEPNRAPHAPAIAPQIVAEHLGGAFGDRQQARAGTQEAGLAGAIGPLEQQDPAPFDVEIDAGEGGEAAKKGNGGPEADGRGHGDAANATGGPSSSSMQGPVRAVATGRPGRHLASPGVDWRQIARGIGKTCIGAGVLVLLFVAYQLWGTGLAESRSQHDLRSSFAKQLPTPSTTVAPGSTPVPPTTATPLPPPPTGEAVAIIRIPRIGVDKAVVEGVGVGDLKKGPGHYPDTPMPGQPGNAAIAGHRTTYGAPFFNLEALRPGDPILVTTRSGSHFEYDVLETKVVKPIETTVVDPTTDNRLTLTTCNPRYSAAQRLVVVARLRGEVTDPPTAPLPAVADPGDATLGPPLALTQVRAGLGGDRGARLPSLLWAIAVLWLGLLIWVIARRLHSWRRWLVYLAFSPAVAVVLFLWFQQVNRLLPANI